jgi:hypothetical protein
MHRAAFFIVHAIGFALLASFSASSFGVNRSVPIRTKGQLKFTRLSHDFGVVTRGQKLEAEFAFENSGDGPIVLQGIHAACGCTATEAVIGSAYQPGDRGAIKVAFDTTDFVGSVSKSITVMSNEVAMPARTLTLSAVIVSDVKVDPPLADLGNVKAGASASMTSVLTSKSADVSIRSVQFNEKVLNVRYREEDRRWLIEVALKPDLPTGFLKETITVETTSKLQREIRIPVRAMLVGPIAHSPSYIEFGAIARQQSTARTVALKGDRQFDLREAKVELHVNGIKQEEPQRFLKLRMDSSPSTEKKVEINLINSDSQAGSVHGRLVFKTTERHQSQLAVDFYAFFL